MLGDTVRLTEIVVHLVTCNPVYNHVKLQLVSSKEEMYGHSHFPCTVLYLSSKSCVNTWNVVVPFCLSLELNITYGLPT